MTNPPLSGSRLASSAGIQNFTLRRIGIDRFPRNPGAFVQTKHRRRRARALLEVFALLLIMLRLVWRGLRSCVRSAVCQPSVPSEPWEAFCKATPVDNNQAKV